MFRKTIILLMLIGMVILPFAAYGENRISGKEKETLWEKEEQAKLRKKENDLKKCEARIAELEDLIAKIDEEMSDPVIGTQMLKLQDLTKQQEALKAELEQKYEEWETLAE